MISAIRQYLQVLLEQPQPTLEALARALAALDLVYFETPQGEVTDPSADALRADYQELYRAIGPRFPGLGLYAVVEPGPDPEAEVMMGDAIDDLADIAKDLQEVVWTLENVGEADARWAFRFLYEVHWGRHLHDLRRYLHAQMTR